jgi:hypothetical protein
MAIPRKDGNGEARPLGNDLQLPEMPTVPPSVQERFPEMAEYQKAMELWWREMRLRLREL